ncbi:MAG: transcriptional repressor [Anaerolineae bacterium]|nr:transcriptional repressor [Thermoflexales bacterium]MDW8406270.1 transcriptional repressor [Anaerolineae bacterium]
MRQSRSDSKTHALDDLAAALNAAGYRVTKPRLAVIEVVLRAGRALSIEEILTRARRLHPQVGLATVYRCIDMLDRIGCSQHVWINGKGYVSACRDERLHYHLVCRRCHTVTEVDVAVCTDALQQSMAEAGFYAQQGAIEVLGTCQACRSRIEERVG